MAIRRFIKTHRVLGSIISLVIIGAGFYGFILFGDYHQRSSYNTAKKSINSVYTSITNAIGPVSSYSESGGCGGFQGEFGEGPTTCVLSMHFTYIVLNKDQSDQYVEKIRNTINRRGDLLKPIPSPPATSGVEAYAPGAERPLETYFRVKGNLNCKISYYYDSSSQSQLLHTYIGCSDHYSSISV